MEYQQRSFWQRSREVAVNFLKVVGIYLFIPGSVLLLLPVAVLAEPLARGTRFDVAAFFALAGYMLGMMLALKIFRSMARGENYIAQHLKPNRLPAKTVFLLIILGLTMQPLTPGPSLGLAFGSVFEISFFLAPLVLLGVVVLEPIIIETMFRCIICRQLKQRFSVLAAVVVQGVLYGLFSIDPLYVFYGIILLLAVLWSGILYAGIIVHGASKYYLLLNYSLVGNPNVYAFRTNLQVVALLALLFILALWLLFRTRRYNALDNNNPYFKIAEATV